MQLLTPVELPPQRLQLTPHSKVMLAGSCFAEHMGERLARCLGREQVCANPFGVMYNPESLCGALADWMQPEPPCWEEDMFQHPDGGFRHWHFATRFEAERPDALREVLQEAWQDGHRALAEADVLLVTLSTDHAYFRVGEEGRRAVANCHKMPARLFHERVLSADAMLAAWRNVLSRLLEQRPELEVVLTVSPYRYAKHGMHASALSKARLLLLADALQQEFGRVLYFPAFEIVTDELRDYRFYAPDMLHPSEQAVDYVWQRFAEWAFTPQLAEFARERMQLLRDAGHRPLHPGSEAHRHFLQRMLERREAFERKWKRSLADA